jgi:mannose-1-phosphate guanylyltransferase
VIEGMPADRPVSVERETFPGLLRGGARVFGQVDSSCWLDLGTPAAFIQGSTDLVAGVAPTAALPKAATHDCDHLSLPGSDIAYDAVLTGG